MCARFGLTKPNSVPEVASKSARTRIVACSTCHGGWPCTCDARSAWGSGHLARAEADDCTSSREPSRTACALSHSHSKATASMGGARRPRSGDERPLRARHGERRRYGGHACERESACVRWAGRTRRVRRAPFVSVASIPAVEARWRDGWRRAPAGSGRARSAIATGVAATSAPAGPARRYGSGRRRGGPWWDGRS